MISAVMMTTLAGVPLPSSSMTATWALPVKISGPVAHPANDGRPARAAVTPITRPYGTRPANHGSMARMPAMTSVHGRAVGTVTEVSVWIEDIVPPIGEIRRPGPAHLQTA